MGEKSKPQESQQSTTRVTGAFDGLSATELKVPALTLLAHPEARRVGELVTLPELAGGQEVLLSRLEPAFAAPGSSDARPLAEGHLSRRPLVLAPGPRPGEVTLERGGCPEHVEVDGEALDEARSFSAEDLERGAVLELGHRVVLAFHRHHPPGIDVPSFGLIGESTPMVRLRQEIAAVAALDVPVLLRGESGTGKELAARAIHDASARRTGPWVAVNMAAIPPTLAAAELFGAARGAYTGADRERHGFFRRAHRGTLFLDEIGEVPSDVQSLLLRVLEGHEIQPVGGGATSKVDVRVISATDSDLEAVVSDRLFRAPLLYRLAGYDIRVPALRERRSDFGRLLYHFLREELTELGISGALEVPDDSGRPWPPADLVARLALLDWPGNVRQLRNAARRLAISRRSNALGPVFLDSLLGLAAAAAEPPPSAGPTTAPSPAPPPRRRPAYRKISDVGEGELLAVLKEHRYELKPTAEALGVARGTLYDLIARSPKVRKAADLSAEEIGAAVERARGDLDAAALELEVSRQGLKRRMKTLGLR